MFGADQRRFWRGAVGLIAAYVIALQAILALSIAAGAAAQNLSHPDASVLLCTSTGNPNAPVDGNSPVKPDSHCLICTLSGSPVAVLPEPVAQPIWRPETNARVSFVSIDACLSFHRSRVGLSRAPPQTA